MSQSRRASASWHMPLPYPAPGTQTIFDPSAYNSAAAPNVSSTGVISDDGDLRVHRRPGDKRRRRRSEQFFQPPQLVFRSFGRVCLERFGNGKTSLRGGYGLTYSRIFTNQDCSFNCANNPPAILSSNLVNRIFQTPRPRQKINAASDDSKPVERRFVFQASAAP